MTNTIPAAFDAAMQSANIDQDTLDMVGSVVSIEINGTRYSARAQMLTVDGVRDAIAECLREHCTLEAVRACGAA